MLKVCLFCGSPIDDNSKFLYGCCHDCGKEIHDEIKKEIQLEAENEQAG